MKLSLSFLLLLLSRAATADPQQCEEISIPMCKEIGYNFTRLPNQFNHESQEEVRHCQEDGGRAVFDEAEIIFALLFKGKGF